MVSIGLSPDNVNQFPETRFWLKCLPDWGKFGKMPTLPQFCNWGRSQMQILGDKERSEMKSGVFVGIVSLITLSFGVVRADWPQYLGPDRNGISPQTGLAKSWPKGGPKVLWTKPLGEGFAGAAIRDGKVYLLDRVKSTEDVLRCYDLETGNELWSFANKDPGEFDSDGSRNPPTVGDKNVYCVGGMGTVYCISRSRHKAVWT